MNIVHGEIGAISCFVGGNNVRGPYIWTNRHADEPDLGRTHGDELNLKGPLLMNLPN